MEDPIDVIQFMEDVCDIVLAELENEYWLDFPEEEFHPAANGPYGV